MAKRATQSAAVASITTAAPSRSDEMSTRTKKYLITMLIRTSCFVGALVAHGWLVWAFLAAAVFLPWVAVVVANQPAKHEETDVESPHFEYLTLPPGVDTEVGHE